MNSSSAALWFIVMVIIVALGAYVLIGTHPSSMSPPTTTSSTTIQTLTTPQGLTIAYDPTMFALASTPGQLLIPSSIPPCDQGFNYCFYLNNGAYVGTNFDSAGLSIQARPDLSSESSCLDTPPAGYDASMQPGATSSTTMYVASSFINLSNAAAGHTAVDSFYRIYLPGSSSCTELETRIAQTAYANYPAGTIGLFTDADNTTVQSQLQSLLDGITIAASGTPVALPAAAAAE